MQRTPRVGYLRAILLTPGYDEGLYLYPWLLVFVPCALLAGTRLLVLLYDLFKRSLATDLLVMKGLS